MRVMWVSVLGNHWTNLSDGEEKFLIEVALLFVATEIVGFWRGVCTFFDT